MHSVLVEGFFGFFFVQLVSFRFFWLIYGFHSCGQYLVIIVGGVGKKRELLFAAKCCWREQEQNAGCYLTDIALQRTRPCPSPAQGQKAPAQSAQSPVLSYENTTLWPLSTISCIIVAFVFSKGEPFWKPIYTNCEQSCSNMYSVDSCSCPKIALTGEAAQEGMLWIFLYLHQ